MGDNELESGKAQLKEMATGNITEVSLDELSNALMNAKHSAALESLSTAIL